MGRKRTNMTEDPQRKTKVRTTLAEENPKIRVINRNGEEEQFDKQRISARLMMLIEKHPKIDVNVVNIPKIVNLAIDQAFDRIHTSEIDKLTSEICA